MRYRYLPFLIFLVAVAVLSGCSQKDPYVEERAKIAEVQESAFELSDEIRAVEVEMSEQHNIHVYVYSSLVESDTDELIEQVEDIARASNLNESDEYYVDVNDISVLIERRRQ